MSSSPEALRLHAAPSAVHVSQDSADVALDALLQRELAARESQGSARATAELSARVDAVSEAFEQEAREVRDELSHAAVQLGLEIARTILRVELKAENYELEGLVRESLALASDGKSPAKVRVSPNDAVRLAAMSLRSGTELVADPAVRNGEVRVETGIGSVVRDPMQCLERLRDSLMEELGR